jgi:hypothetical protein
MQLKAERVRFPRGVEDFRNERAQAMAGMLARLITGDEVANAILRACTSWTTRPHVSCGACGARPAVRVTFP